MKKITVIFLIIGILSVAAYFMARHFLDTPGFQAQPAKDPAAAAKPPQSPIDLRPKLIARLQELVKKGSDGLYNLSIHEAEPDILRSEITLSRISFVPDSAVLRQLEALKKAPDYVFSISAGTLRIEGIGLRDLLSKDAIDLKAIYINEPIIEVYHSKGANNGKKTDSTSTFYQRLMKQMKHIGIDRIIIQGGTFVNHNKKENKTSKFNNIAIRLSGVLIDSSTQYDRTRFLFAKQAELSMENFSQPTSNNLYDFKIGTVSVSATSRVLTAKNILLQPRYSKKEFQSKIKSMKERYAISLPSVQFRDIDWWQLLNENILQARFAEMDHLDVEVYLDRSGPAGKPQLQGFPHQLIMKLPMKLNIQTVQVNDLDVVYEEFSVLSGKTGKLFLNDLHGKISNLTNLPSAIKRNSTTTVTASGNLMNLSPVDLSLRFDLSHYRTGAFSAALETKKSFDGQKISPLSEPLGLFMVKRGELKKLSAHISGNNYKASGQVVFLYDNLHITPMKKDESKPDGLKKKSVTSFIANTFVLKEENPKNGEQRKADASFTRSTGTFFNLIWKTTFVGILKTIGAPEKLAYQ
jgi:hypothetical protein